MKPSYAAGLVAALLGTTDVVAQGSVDALTPFFLQLHSSNITYNNRYLFACNTGAATETLCHGTELSPRSAAMFTWASTYAPNAGVLIRNMELGGRSVPAAMALIYNPGTNPKPPPGLTTIGFDNKVMYVAAPPDDRHNQDGVVPDPSKYKIGYFYMCWMLAGNSYNTVLAWASTTPQNPTCQGVQVSRAVPAV
ncbi:hypothetical protein QBC39DRAFT_269442 [Podospora conica]|nr:hypothetical protein QBC39DRAFT_269442 [Schizothecium conicum]